MGEETTYPKSELMPKPPSRSLKEKRPGREESNIISMKKKHGGGFGRMGGEEYRRSESFLGPPKKGWRPQ